MASSASYEPGIYERVLQFLRRTKAVEGYVVRSWAALGFGLYAMQAQKALGCEWSTLIHISVSCRKPFLISVRCSPIVDSVACSCSSSGSYLCLPQNHNASLLALFVSPPMSISSSSSSSITFLFPLSLLSEDPASSSPAPHLSIPLSNRS